VAQTRPLTLRSEKYSVRRKSAASTNAVASVWVDSSVYHLDQPFDYLIEEALDSVVQVGVRVIVPLNSREVEGLVIERRDGEQSRNLKWIIKALSPVPVATSNSIDLIRKVAHHWAANPFDVIRAAIPPRVARIDKDQWSFSPIMRGKEKKSSTYLQLPPSANPARLIQEYCAKNRAVGTTLIVMPDYRSVRALQSLIPGSIILASELSKEVRYHNYLQSLYGAQQIVIGTRSAIFAPIRDLSEIIIYDEGSDNHYEMRTPGWNTRDVARLRALLEGTSLTYIGYCPSAEIAALIEKGEIRYRSGKSSVKVIAQQSEQGELIPSRIFALIRSTLKSGSVLCIAPRKGYAHAISCSKCRNVATCDCGGKLIQESVHSSLRCNICLRDYTDWNCSWCNAKSPYLLARGSERFSYELGKALPGYRIIESHAESIKEEIDSHALVVATPGAIPQHSSGYQLIVLLNGDQFFSWADVRGIERAQAIAFSSAGYLAHNGTYAVILNPNHPVVGALASWKPSLLNKRELQERETAGLPPYSRAISLEIPQGEGQQIVRGLERSISDGRLPSRTKIYGPLDAKGDLVRIVLFAPFDDGDALVEVLHEFQRKRSASGKNLAHLRVDPYSI
jgi:primosomal protein N' (replication factor Y)